MLCIGWGGVLYEVSPFGTGFIEDTATGRMYGFHKSMLRVVMAAGELEGAVVRFRLNSLGTVQSVDLVDE